MASAQERRKILRLPSNKRTRRQHIMVIPPCTYLLVRRKILRLPCNKRTHRQHIIAAPPCENLLVRRKILRLYRAVAIEGMVWGTAVREPFVNLAS